MITRIILSLVLGLGFSCIAMGSYSPDDVVNFDSYYDDDGYGDNRPTYCRATVVLFEKKDGFKRVEDAFDFCFDLVKAFGLDTSKGWKERYCKVERYKYRDDYDFTDYDPYGDYRFRVEFKHEDKFRSRYPSSLLLSIDQKYTSRFFKGRELKIIIKFSDHCKYKD